MPPYIVSHHTSFPGVETNHFAGDPEKCDIGDWKPILTAKERENLAVYMEQSLDRPVGGVRIRWNYCFWGES